MARAIDWVRFEPGALVLTGYPFERAERSTRIEASQLVDVSVGWFPPAVLTKEGEFVFVPAPKAGELRAFAIEHRVPFVRRLDIWSLLLEPFLDTELPRDQSENIYQLLEKHEVPRKEADQVREALKFRMLMLTAITWEWQHYGMFDALSQMKGFPFLSGWTFARFYDYAMSLAGRGSVTPATPEEFFPPPKK
jgi:hypothetical protein